MGVVVPDSAIEEPPEGGRALDPKGEWHPTGSLPEDKQESFVWLPNGLAEGTLGEVVGQSLGAASACWANLRGAGVFDSTQCKAILDGLMAYLSDWEAVVRSEANENTAVKLQHRAVESATTQHLLEELHARGGKKDLEDNAVLFALTGALMRSLSTEVLQGTGADG